MTEIEQAAEQAAPEAPEATETAQEINSQSSMGSHHSSREALVAAAIQASDSEGDDGQETENQEQAKTEVLKPETPAPETKTAELDPSIAQRELEQREMQYRQRDLELKQREMQLQGLKKYEELEKLRKSDPLAYIEQSGLNMDDVLNRVVDGNNPSADELRRADMERIEGLQKKMETLETEIQRRDADAELRRYQNEGETIINSSDDTKWIADYADLVNQTPGSLVSRVLSNYYQATQQTLTAQEAVDIIAKEVGPKWKSKFGGSTQPPVVPEPAAANQPATKTTKSTTMSNSMTSKVDADFDGLPWEEKKARLAASLKFIEHQ